MQAILHALNIGTLATWLSVAGAGTVALVVGTDDRSRGRMDLRTVEEGELSMQVEEQSAGSAPAAESLSESPEPLPVSPSSTESQLAIPEMPELAESAPLPEIPNLPDPGRTGDMKDPDSKPVPSASSTPRQSARGGGKTASSPQSGSGAGKGGGTSTGTGSGAVGAARWAGGRMPAPSYPPEARRYGQEGRVVVLFSVDEQGNVVSASVTGPCPYPLLNEEAVRAVRRWKFQPGVRASLKRPIIFKLN